MHIDIEKHIFIIKFKKDVYIKKCKNTHNKTHKY